VVPYGPGHNESGVPFWIIDTPVQIEDCSRKRNDHLSVLESRPCNLGASVRQNKQSNEKHMQGRENE